MMPSSMPRLPFLFVAIKAAFSTEIIKLNHTYGTLEQTKHIPNGTLEQDISSRQKLCVYKYKKGILGMVCVCKAMKRIDQIPLKEIIKNMDKKYKFCHSLSFQNFRFGILENMSFDAFEQLSRVYLKNCSIMKIEKNAFKSKSFLTLKNIIIQIEMNPIEHIEPSTFNTGISYKQLVIQDNQNLGTKNILSVFHDLHNKTVNNLEIKTCGVFLKELNKSFFEPLRFSKIKKLDIGGNSFGIVASDAFEPLGAFLTSLQLWNFMYVKKESFEVFHRLTHLKIGGFISTLSNNPLQLHIHNISGLSSLSIDLRGAQSFELDVSGLKNLREVYLINAHYVFRAHIKQVLGLLNTAKSLKQINLSGNALSKLTDQTICEMFENRATLNTLFLKYNNFYHLPRCMFRGLYTLRNLNLQNNLLRIIEKDLFEDLNELSILDLSQNSITFIDSSNVEIMRPFRGQVKFNIRENNLECNCQVKGLRNWITRNIMQNRYQFIYHNVRCSTPTMKQNEYLHNFTMTWLECNIQLVIKVSSVSGSFILFLTILTIVLIRHFWKDIQYRKMIIMARKNEQEINIHGLLIEHDAFVSYHSEKQLWVERNLCNELENGDDIKFKLVYDDRIMPGGSLFTSLGNAIHTSRKILFVVSRGWVNDAMNQFEVDMALAKLLDDYRDMIIVLLMEHIPKDEMPDKVKMIIKHNNCLRWSNNEKKQGKFWRDLKLELGKHHFDIPTQEPHN